jgi:hypothetical protein
MADLVVDTVLLAETAGSLGMLMHEFQRAADIVDDAGPAIGRNALQDELREFVDEWKHNREKLLTSLQAVYEAATCSRAAYIQADNELAASLQVAAEECRP